MRERIRIVAVAVTLVVTVSCFFFRSCVATTNEFGFLGADKNGRQIYLQTLDHVSSPQFHVTSEFYDHSIFLRFLQEPMRTTIRFVGSADTQNMFTRQAIDQLLATPAVAHLMQFRDSISLTKEYSLPTDKMIERAGEKGVFTYREFLVGMGFQRLEVFNGPTKQFALTLDPRVVNTKERVFINTAGTRSLNELK